MERGLIFLLLVFLSGCQNNKQAFCRITKDDIEVSVDIEAINDDIKNIHIRESISIPYDTLLDKEKFNDLKKQLNDNYVIEDNHIVYERDEVLDKTYSFNDTKQRLIKEHFYCE